MVKAQKRTETAQNKKGGSRPVVLGKINLLLALLGLGAEGPELLENSGLYLSPWKEKGWPFTKYGLRGTSTGTGLSGSMGSQSPTWRTAMPSSRERS
jgi:hypothetical protein